jgi:hypothetical protein
MTQFGTPANSFSEAEKQGILGDTKRGGANQILTHKPIVHTVTIGHAWRKVDPNWNHAQEVTGSPNELFVEFPRRFFQNSEAKRN